MGEGEGREKGKGRRGKGGEGKREGRGGEKGGKGRGRTPHCFFDKSNPECKYCYFRLNVWPMTCIGCLDEVCCNSILFVWYDSMLFCIL